MLIIESAKFSNMGNTNNIVIESKLNGKIFLTIKQDAGGNYNKESYFKFTGTDDHPNDFIIRLQIAAETSVDNGEYYAIVKLYRIGNPNNGILTKEQLNLSYDDDISNIKAELTQTLKTVQNKNLFNKNDPANTPDSFIYSNGDPLHNQYTAAYGVTDFIKIKPNTAYTLSPNNTSNTGCAFYDSNKKLLNYCRYDLIGGSSNMVSADGAAWCRFTYILNKIDSTQFEEGAMATSYEEYGYLDSSQIKKNAQDIATLKANIPTGLRVVIPNTLYTCKDHCLSLYFENMIYKSLKDDGDLRFTLGNRTSRLQQLLFTEVKTQNMQIYLDKACNRIQTKQISCVTVDPILNKNKNINLLCIGDSFTDIGRYCIELKNLLKADGANVTLVGTCGNGNFLAEGLSGGRVTNSFLDSSQGAARIVKVTGAKVAPSTGYPGQRYKDSNGNEWTIRSSKINSDGTGMMAVTKLNGCVEANFSNFPASGTLTKTSSGPGDATINYSNPTKAYFNPFIDPTSGELDIKSYLTRWNQPTPNIIVIQFTFNDIYPTITDSGLKTIVTNYIKGVEHIHANLPDCKIVLSVEPYGAINKDYNWNLRKERVLTWVEMLMKTFESDTYSSYVKIAPSYACVDLINGYSTSTVKPSTRYDSITEIATGDGVHPSTGMLEIADCIYPCITYLLQ